MEQHVNGPAALAISWIAGIITFFSPEHIGETLKIMSALVSIISGLFAIRYYYLKTKQ